ncbi:MAG: 50S ribosomal protein L17 [Candidatus Margulisiibacteriota bacterium]|jgi:large subunit ribosomal protein L17
MRHACKNKKLGLPTDQRIALLRSLTISLFKYKAIETTDARAKEAKRMIEKVITLGKKGDLHSRRLALKILPDKEIVKEVFASIAGKYAERNGGYTRITKIGLRKGDAATISKLELID